MIAWLLRLFCSHDYHRVWDEQEYEGEVYDSPTGNFYCPKCGWSKRPLTAGDKVP